MPKLVIPPEQLLIARLEALKTTLLSDIDPLSELLTDFINKEPQALAQIKADIDMLRQQHETNGEQASNWMVNENHRESTAFILTYIHESRRLALSLAEQYNCEVLEDTSLPILHNDEDESIKITQNDLDRVDMFVEYHATASWDQLPYFKDLALNVEQTQHITQERALLKETYVTNIIKLIQSTPQPSEQCQVLDQNDLDQAQQIRTPSSNDYNPLLQAYKMHRAVQKRFDDNQQRYQQLLAPLQQDMENNGLSLGDVRGGVAEMNYIQLHGEIVAMSTNIHQALSDIKTRIHQANSIFSKVASTTEKNAVVSTYDQLSAPKTK